MHSQGDSTPTTMGIDADRTQAAHNSSNLESAIDYTNVNILRLYPNDLTRLIYLATLRDNNTGVYIEPRLVGWGEVANQALQYCHSEVFNRLLNISVEDYVHQLRVYAHYANVQQGGLIRMWKRLVAYRSTIPLQADPLSAEFFYVSVDAALSILSREQKT